MGCYHITSTQAPPIKQPPRRPPLSALSAEDEILDEMLRTGVVNAPASFCRLMQLIFKNMLHKCCFVYLDDIIVFASTPEELIERLDAVFTRLRDHGLKAKASKCVLFKSPIEFLGHVVSAEGIQPQTETLDKIQNWNAPHCMHHTFTDLLVITGGS